MEEFGDATIYYCSINHFLFHPLIVLPNLSFSIPLIISNPTFFFGLILSLIFTLHFPYQFLTIFNFQHLFISVFLILVLCSFFHSQIFLFLPFLLFLFLIFLWILYPIFLLIFLDFLAVVSVILLAIFNLTCQILLLVFSSYLLPPSIFLIYPLRIISLKLYYFPSPFTLIKL